MKRGGFIGDISQLGNIRRKAEKEKCHIIREEFFDAVCNSEIRQQLQDDKELMDIDEVGDKERQTKDTNPLPVRKLAIFSDLMFHGERVEILLKLIRGNLLLEADCSNILKCIYCIKSQQCQNYEHFGVCNGCIVILELQQAGMTACMNW